MATSKIAVTEGSGKNIASYSVSEDAATKELQRIVESDSSGNAIYEKTRKTSVVSLSASGNVIAAVASKLIKVYQFEIQSLNDGMTVKFTDGNGGSNLGFAWNLNTREGVMSSVATPPNFLFKNASVNTAIYAVITGTGTVNITARYWDDDAS